MPFICCSSLTSATYPNRQDTEPNGPKSTSIRLPDGTSALLAETRDRVLRDLDAFISGGADYGLIHADLVRENILVSGSDIRMIDFDDSGFGFRLFDIATALVKNRNEPHYDAMMGALIEGCRTQRELPQRELDSLPLFILLRALTYLGWAEARKTEPDMETRRARLKTDALALARAYLVAD